MKEIFEKIIKENLWSRGRTESPCGPGSSIKYTENLRLHFPLLVEKFNIKSILDAPCGDFNWMKLVVPTLDVDYTGADIVPVLVENNINLYKTDKIKFEVIDITRDKLPDADLMVCRDCLFHLSNDSIKLFFDNFLNSNIKYLLTTTHYNNADFKNTDIKDGNFRLLDLFSAPFEFDKDVLYQIDDWIDGYNPRGMILLSREQIERRHSLNSL
jgi:hypothetical protein